MRRGDGGAERRRSGEEDESAGGQAPRLQQVLERMEDGLMALRSALLRQRQSAGAPNDVQRVAVDSQSADEWREVLRDDERGPWQLRGGRQHGGRQHGTAVGGMGGAWVGRWEGKTAFSAEEEERRRREKR